MDFARFILEHDADDLPRLALSRARFEREVEDFPLALSTLEARRKLRAKVPEWVSNPALRYPRRLSAEQCSSSETARYKARVAFSAAGEDAGASLADLTGGLGVDSWAFSALFSRVLYNEMLPDLADAARHNFASLGAGNISVRSGRLSAETLSGILGEFRPDILYLDPARRAADGRKVFRLEDCEPCVPELLPALFEACPLLLLKLSPMADISLVCKQLAYVKEVHVVAAEGECKELLLLLERGYGGPRVMTVYENGSALEVPAAGQGGAESFGPPAGGWLYEPGKALAKAGAFELPCHYGLVKFSRHTHLYTAGAPVKELAPFGKWYQILEVMPLNKRSIKELAGMYPGADVSARNLPLSSDELRAKLAAAGRGGHSAEPPVHIFGLRADTPPGNLLLVCRRGE